MTFYAIEQSQSLRQGDIVFGLPILEPSIQGKPIQDIRHSYQIDSSVCHCVVITPCCSIEDGRILLSPLKKLTGKFTRHEIFGPNPLRINEPVEPVESIGPTLWAKLSPEDQIQREAEGTAYALLYMFVYDGHPSLPVYQLRDHDTQIHFVDFRNSFTVKWDEIKRQSNNAIDVKVAELSMETRKLFRNKIKHFYGRIPVEDQAVYVALQ